LHEGERSFYPAHAKLKNSLNAYLWVALGSAIGGCARFAIGTGVAHWLGIAFPWGTLSINVIGCFAIGILASNIESAAWRQFLMVGFCGGFTTFSSFSLETLNLLKAGQPVHAAAYVIASVLLCMVAVWAGHSFR
jgi:fluoride exporter